MARGKVLAVFCYDISRDKWRLRASKLLDDYAVRVQESVFEGWMTEARARSLAERIGLFIDETDSLRLYMLGASAPRDVVVYGATPPVESHEFFLL
jgi:CRISPR-associated endonuclease Cas2